MEQSGLKRHAAQAIVMVGVATALVSAGLRFFPRSESNKAPTDANDAWHRFSERCTSDTLLTLTTAEADFRSCDRDGNKVNDISAADTSSLPAGATSQPGPEPRAEDHPWCHVNDFWSEPVAGLYTLTGSVATPAESELQTIKLIELSVASADEDEESPD